MQIFEAVRLNMSNMVKYSEIEFAEYKKTGNIVYLQQAGEKLFNAIENYIQYINKIQAQTFYEIKGLVKEKALRKLLYDGRELHRFFYNGELEMNKEDAEELFINVKNRLKNRIR